MTSRNAKSAAFTLLEMLVATAMVAVLAGSLYASLSIAFKARRSALAVVEPVRKVEIALAQGKKLYDKRDDIKRRASDRQMARAVRHSR